MAKAKPRLPPQRTDQEIFFDSWGSCAPVYQRNFVFSSSQHANIRGMICANNATGVRVREIPIRIEKLTARS